MSKKLCDLWNKWACKEPRDWNLKILDQEGQDTKLSKTLYLHGSILIAICLKTLAKSWEAVLNLSGFWNIEKKIMANTK